MPAKRHRSNGIAPSQSSELAQDIKDIVSEHKAEQIQETAPAAESKAEKSPSDIYKNLLLYINEAQSNSNHRDTAKKYWRYNTVKPAIIKDLISSSGMSLDAIFSEMDKKDAPEKRKTLTQCIAELLDKGHTDMYILNELKDMSSTSSIKRVITKLNNSKKAQNE